MDSCFLLLLIVFSIIIAGIITYFLLFFADTLVDNVREKYVLITGCDSGFGKLLAQTLDKDGVHVFAACLTEDGQKELQDLCSDNLRTLKLDVTNSQQIQQAVEYVKGCLPAGKGLWGLVNNAGIIRNAPLDWVTDKDMKVTIEVNVWGVVNVTKALLPLLKQEKGRIVNMASICGRVSFPYHSAYAISKFAVEAFSDCLRLEMKPFEVSVHIIEPGLFKTNMTNADNVKKDIDKAWNQASESTKKEYGDDFLPKIYKLVNALSKKGSPHPEYVSNAMRHALLSTKPKHRYRVGWSIALYFLLYFPTWISDHFYSKWPRPVIRK